jgi:hypothetical protein
MHEIFANTRSFLFNVPTEEITYSKQLLERKNQAKMTQDERQRFTSGTHVAIHGDMSHRMHSAHHGEPGTQQFLLWHRVCMYQLEAMLQAFDPGISIPYWDWAVDQNILQSLEGFTPTVTVNGEPRKVRRTPGLLWRSLPSD